MDREYKFELTTPGGSCKASAGSPEDLAFFVPAGVVNSLQPGPDNPQQRNLESVAAEVLESLRAYLLDKRQRGAHTVMSRAGLELALIKCFLRDMTVDEAHARLADKCDVNVSRSAVGRYWKHLHDLGVTPINELLPTETQAAF